MDHQVNLAIDSGYQGALEDTYGRLVAERDGSFLPLLGDGQVMPFETQIELFKKK